jgi:hypothetical protein
VMRRSLRVARQRGCHRAGGAGRPGNDRRQPRADPGRPAGHPRPAVPGPR